MVRIGIAVFVSLMFVLSLYPQDNADQEAVELFKKGLELYKQKKYSEAYTEFQKAFELKPSWEVVWAFIRRTEEDIVAEMLNSPDPLIKEIGYKLLKYSAPVIKPREFPAEEIQNLIEALKSPEFDKFFAAQNKLVLTGPYAVRYLIPLIGDETIDVDIRSRIMQTLIKIKYDATLALCEVLKATKIEITPEGTQKDIFQLLKQNAAIVLGNIADARAVPALKRLWEDKNQAPHVRKFANEAIQKITGKTVDQLKSAKELYVELAEDFYHSKETAIPVYQEYHLVWEWDVAKNQLLEYEHYGFIYNEIIAEKLCLEALELDPEYKPAWVLLTLVCFAQFLEYENAIAHAEFGQKYAGIETELVEKLKKEFAENTSRSKLLATLPGKRILYKALNKALKEGSSGVAIKIIETLTNIGSWEELPPHNIDELPDEKKAKFFGYPLIDALISRDVLVRQAAAEALIKLNPQGHILNMELVIKNLESALGMEAARTAIIIHKADTPQDLQTINRLKALLELNNVFASISYSGYEGIEKVKRLPGFDLIFLHSKVAPEILFVRTVGQRREEETVLDTLKKDIRTKNIPIYLICDNPGEIEQLKPAYTDKIERYIIKDIDKSTLYNLLEETFAREEYQRDFKARADRIAARAAETLASIDPTCSYYPYQEVVDKLIETVSTQKVRREHFIRLPAIIALGRFADPEAIDVLIRIIDDPQEKSLDEQIQEPAKKIRVSAARALVEIVRKNKPKLKPEIFETLKKHLYDGDYAIEVAISEVFSNADLTPQQRYELEKYRRLKYQPRS